MADTPATACPNCGARVDGAYCPSCGQAARELRAPLRTLFADFLDAFFSFDGRIPRTVARLLLPGRLTRLWLEGRRASHVPPARVYLVASLLFFVLVGFPTPDASEFNVYVDDVLIGRDEPQPGLGTLQLGLSSGDSALGRLARPFVAPHVEALKAMPAQRLVDGFFGGLQRTVPTTLVFFVPVLAAAIALLHLRRPFYFVDHLVFALHFQSFLFVLFVGVRLANDLGLRALVPPALAYVLAFLFGLPAYLVTALRHVYRQSWPVTLLKAGALLVLYLALIQPVMAVTMIWIVRSM